MKRIILVCWLCFSATSVYAEGIWIADKKTGCQVLLSPDYRPDVSVYWSGECKENKVEGDGTLTIKDGNVFIKFDGVMRNGECIRIRSSESTGNITYIGELKNSVPDGNGTLTWKKTGEFYSGEFKNGSLTGKGTKVYSNGDKYVGEFKSNNKHGEGILFYRNGDKYSGSWSNDRQHGKGKYTFKDGTSYEGLWEHGERIKIF